MTPIDRARRTLVDVHGFRADTAAIATKAVLDELGNPDDAMRTAGAAEVRHAAGAGGTGPYARDLAATIWRAMLFRADR